MEVAEAVRVLQVRHILSRVVEGVFCIVRTARPQAGNPIRKDGPFLLLR